METASLLGKLWVATKHQYIPRETMNTRVTLCISCSAALAAIVDIVRHYGFDTDWNDDTAVALKVRD